MTSEIENGIRLSGNPLDKHFTFFRIPVRNTLGNTLLILLYSLIRLLSDRSSVLSLSLSLHSGFWVLVFGIGLDFPGSQVHLSLYERMNVSSYNKWCRDLNGLWAFRFLWYLIRIPRYELCSFDRLLLSLNLDVKRINYTTQVHFQINSTLIKLILITVNC